MLPVSNLVLSNIYGEEKSELGFLTWKEAVVAAALLALLILYLVLRDR